VVGSWIAVVSEVSKLSMSVATEEKDDSFQSELELSHIRARSEEVGLSFLE
jgi:hypothetical protein